MDIGKAFSYVFEDPNWLKKVGIGGLVSIVPIVNFAAIGYMLTTMKNVADGQAQPMPEWSDFGGYFMKGLYAFVGILVYFLPAIVVYCCVIVLGAVASGGAGAVGGRNASDAAGTAVSFLALCLQCVLGLYSLVAGLTLYAPLTRFAMSNNQLNLFWDFKGNLDFIQKNLSAYVMALLVTWLAYIVGGFGVILCVVGVFFTYFWAGQVAAYLFGQFWKNRVASAAG